jgi:L-galactose dehydrogenase
MELRTLGKTGLRVSVVGFGAASLGNMYEPIDEAVGRAAVHRALDLGINLFDTSPYYGETLSETLLGKALAGGRRERVVLCTKVGRITKTRFDFSADFIARSLDDSLRRLQTDHLDVFHAHDIEFADDFERIFAETAGALERAKQQGKCRFIGMTGLPVRLLVQAIERCPLDVVLSYCHCNLLDSTMKTLLLPAAQRRGVGVFNASPLAMGLLRSQAAPAWHPAPPELHAAARRAAEVCTAAGVELADLAQQAVFHDAAVTTTFVGMARPEEVEASVRAVETPPDAGLLAAVQAVLAPVQNVTWPSGNFPI